MEKIIKIESLIAEGKQIDEEQKIMYTTKSSVEKSLSDLKSVLQSLEEVAKEEKEKEGNQQLSHTSSYQSLSNAGTEECKGAEELCISGKKVAIVETFDAPVASGYSEASVVKLLRALNLYSRYTAGTGAELPAEIRQVGAAVLGAQDAQLSGAQAAVKKFLDVSAPLNHVNVAMYVLACVCSVCVWRCVTILGSGARVPSPSCCRKAYCTPPKSLKHFERALA